MSFLTNNSAVLEDDGLAVSLLVETLLLNTVERYILRSIQRSIKKCICKTEKFKFFKVCSNMHSIMVGAPLAQITASVRCGMKAISLCRALECS